MGCPGTEFSVKPCLSSTVLLRLNCWLLNELWKDTFYKLFTFSSLISSLFLSPCLLLLPTSSFLLFYHLTSSLLVWFQHLAIPFSPLHTYIHLCMFINDYVLTLFFPLSLPLALVCVHCECVHLFATARVCASMKLEFCGGRKQVQPEGLILHIWTPLWCHCQQGAPLVSISRRGSEWGRSPSLILCLSHSSLAFFFRHTHTCIYADIYCLSLIICLSKWYAPSLSHIARVFLTLTLSLLIDIT